MADRLSTETSLSFAIGHATMKMVAALGIRHPTSERSDSPPSTCPKRMHVEFQSRKSSCADKFGATEIYPRCVWCVH